MDNLYIEATDRSPAVSFEFSKGHLQLSGESYPEDANGFYKPIFEALDSYLDDLGSGECRFDFELIYFNSSSAKAIMTMMDKLEEAAASGAAVNVHWRYDVEDDNMKELGEELGEDLEEASFHLEELDDDG
ncbi:MAG: DUF1987 domain-containing protein [Pseudomonadota bacterium]